MKFIKTRPLVIIFIFILALIIRILLFPFTNPDLDHFVLPWYEFIQSHNGFPALEFGFSNYSPAYPTLLVLLSYLNFFPPVIRFKLLSVVFDFLIAWFAGKIIFRITQSQTKQLIAIILTLFSPVLIVISSYWGQSDSIYTFWLVLSFYWLISNKPISAVLSFGFAFAFKFQAMFFAPFLLVYYLKTRKNILHFLLIPIPYLLTSIPTLLAGRPFIDVMTIYVKQTDYYKSLTMNAPNFYVYLPNSRYEFLALAGLIATCLIFIILIGLIYFSKKQTTPIFWLTVVSFFLFLAPMILPKMHDRYLYAAALFLVLLAVVRPKNWYIAAGLQITSLLSYTYFFTTNNQGWLSIKIVAFINIMLLSLMVVEIQRKYGLLDSILHKLSNQ